MAWRCAEALEAAAIDAMVASEREAALRLKDGTVLAKRRRTMLGNLCRVAEVDNTSRKSDTTAVGRIGNFDPDHKKQARRDGCGTSHSTRHKPHHAWQRTYVSHGDVESENAELRTQAGAGTTKCCIGSRPFSRSMG